MAVLQQLFGDQSQAVHPLNGKQTVLGRQDNCDIVLNLRAVSRQHAKVTCEDNRYFVEDLESRNGTKLNGVPVAERTLLNNGDRLEVSTLPFIFLSENSLSELSGSWGVKPGCISLTGLSDKDNSIRRQVVQEGDRISGDTLGSDGLRESQLVARIQVADGAGAWPVTHDAAAKLNHTLRLIHSLRSMVKRDDILSRTLESLFDVFPAAERIAVVLRDDTSDGVQVAAAAGRRRSEEIEVCLPIIRTAMQSEEALLYVDHVRNTEGDNPDLDAPHLRSILVAPLVRLIGRSIGAIQIDSNDARRPLSRECLEKFVILANVISFVLEQTTAIDVAIHKAVLDRETLDAHRLRGHISSAEPPNVDGFQIDHRLISSPTVTSDLVDYVRLADGRVACVLIDVPGKGPEAAGLMALLSRLMVQGVGENNAPGTALRRAEEELANRLSEVPEGISVAIAIPNQGSSVVSVAVAGRCPVMTIRDGSTQELNVEQQLGGFFAIGNAEYAEYELELDEGNAVFVFSDGITQLASPTGQTLNRAGRLAIVDRAADRNRSTLPDRLETELTEYSDGALLADDVSFIMIHCHGNNELDDGEASSPVESDTRDE